MTANSAPARLGGVSEVAAELQVSRQRVAVLRRGSDFPAPVAVLTAGEVWDLDDIRRWAESGVRRGAGRPSPAAAPRSVGRRFELGSIIGGGGFAEVFNATDLTSPDKDQVAVKVLKQIYALQADTVARFERELQLMSKFSHQNVMPFLASGKDDDLGHWYAMPLARGVLADVGGPMSTDDVVAVMRDICAGLAYVHSEGILHRDLKPGNVLRTSAGAWAIADFGLARIVEESGLLTSTYDGMGTRFFVAPEQWRDAKHVDERADIYSAGKVMQTLLTGAIPVDDDIPPGPLRPVVQRAISQDANRRHSSVTELLAAVEAAVAPAPAGRWETDKEKADRLRPRLKAGRIADGAALVELMRWADSLNTGNDDEMRDFVPALVSVPSSSLKWWWGENPAGFLQLFRAFADHLGESFAFDWCDSLADFVGVVVHSVDDAIVLREAVSGLTKLGANHNRWHVRDVLIGILQSIRTAEDAGAAMEGLRLAGTSAADWAVGGVVIRTFHPTLRSGLATLLDLDE